METTGLKSCLQDTNCCLTSQPCQNGATCVFNKIAASLRDARFTCKCRPGYNGNYCEQPIRSCRGYLANKKFNKTYILDETNTSFRVKCTFGKKATWTLIQSFKFRNKSEIEKASLNDTSLNNESPLNYLFRITVSKMKSIQKNSTLWRIRRTFHKKIKKCQDRKTVRITGTTCSDCNVLVKQDSKWSPNKTACVIENNGGFDCTKDKNKVYSFGLPCCVSSPDKCGESDSNTKFNIELGRIRRLGYLILVRYR